MDLLGEADEAFVLFSSLFDSRVLYVFYNMPSDLIVEAGDLVF